MADQSSRDRRDGAGSGRMSTVRAVRQACEQLPALVGRPIDSVLGIERGEDGWTVTVAVVELSRIPNSTDVLGAYTVELDGDGELVGYRRRRRYNRGQADEDQ